jgi:hypothetical protein
MLWAHLNKYLKNDSSNNTCRRKQDLTEKHSAYTPVTVAVKAGSSYAQKRRSWQQFGIF